MTNRQAIAAAFIKQHARPAAPPTVPATVPQAPTTAPRPTMAPSTAPAGSRTERRVEAGQKTIQRAQENQCPANDAAVIAGFVAMGIPQAEIRPRENVFTFNAWIAQGRAVNKGAHGVKIPTFTDLPPKVDEQSGEIEEIGGRKRTSAAVFHISQTHPIDEPSTPTGDPTP